MNLLACDIGNSFIKFGLYQNGDRIHFFRSPAVDLTLHFLEKFTVDAVSISSVVPASTNLLSNLIEKKLGIKPFVVSMKSKFNLQIDYDTPETLGIDRLCGAEGAFAIHTAETGNKKLRDGEAIISVDFGTATTVNVIKNPNIFSGGLISPGMQMMIEILNSNTAQLPVAELSDYKSPLAKSTKSAIAGGIINSVAGMINQVAGHLTANENVNTIQAYVTGGNAREMMKYLSIKHEYVEDLVLRGAKSIYELNSGK